MFRKPAPLVFTLAALAACATDPTTSPTSTTGTTTDRPELALLPIFGYQATVLPLDLGRAINAVGDVVGTEGGKGMYWEYKTGTTIALPVPATVDYITPVDVVDDGRVLARGNGMQGPKAFYYPSRSAAPIDIVPQRWAEPESMNDDGVAVGRYGNDRGWGGWRWTPDGGVVDITPPGFDFAWPLDISPKGYVMGWVQLGNAVTGYAWKPVGAPGAALPSGLAVYQALDGGGVLVRAPGLGSAIWTPASLTGVGPDPLRYHVERISPIGRLVGSVTDPDTRSRRAWTSYYGNPIILPLPPGFQDAWAVDVNACGMVLGRGTLTGTTTQRAIVWAKSYSCDIGPGSTDP